MELFEPAVKGVKVSTPHDELAEMGPLITAGSATSVLSYVDEDVVAFRGSAPSGPGFWYPPTVLETKDPKSRSFREEIFGPVVSVMRFKDEAEAIAHRERQPLRALGIDLEPRRGPGAARGARRRDGRPVGELELVGALLNALWWFQAVRNRP
jgi:hypothetical protein